VSNPRPPMARWGPVNQLGEAGAGSAALVGRRGGLLRIRNGLGVQRLSQKPLDHRGIERRGIGGRLRLVVCHGGLRASRNTTPTHDLLTGSCQHLAGRTARAHAPGMFVVTEDEAAAIRAVFEQHGEFAAAVELRRLFPGVTDNDKARECARTIAGWQPLPPVKRMPKPSRATWGREQHYDFGSDPTRLQELDDAARELAAIRVAKNAN